jgi:hypothetical protein
VSDCIIDPNNEIIIEVMKEISNKEPRGMFPDEIHETMIAKYNRCMDLYSTARQWSPFIERAIQVLLDADLGYKDMHGRIHLNEVAEELLV